MKIFLKKFRKKVLENTWRPFLLWYLSRNRLYKYNNLSLVIFPGVFHPGFFFSTKIFLEFLESIPASGKKILELGSGSGLISLKMARRGGKVFASDISTKAVNNTLENARRNNLEINVIQSDLFQKLSGEKFDLIIVNPPYYPYDPSSESERAWYCGKDFDYFLTFFNQLKNHIHQDSEVYMILSEDCDLSAIEKVASQNKMKMVRVYQKRNFFEWNYIFRIVPGTL
jgi:release factor glutamine methyltransferase